MDTTKGTGKRGRKPSGKVKYQKWVRAEHVELVDAYVASLERGEGVLVEPKAVKAVPVEVAVEPKAEAKPKAVQADPKPAKVEAKPVAKAEAKVVESRIPADSPFANYLNPTPLGDRPVSERRAEVAGLPRVERLTRPEGGAFTRERQTGGGK